MLLNISYGELARCRLAVGVVEEAPEEREARGELDWGDSEHNNRGGRGAVGTGEGRRRERGEGEDGDMS